MQLPVDDTEPPEVAETSNPYCGSDALTVIVKLDLTSKDPDEVLGKVAVEGKAALDVIDEIVQPVSGVNVKVAEDESAQVLVQVPLEQE